MKFKALRKISTGEFAEIQEYAGVNMVFISELPNPQPMTATVDLMKQMYGNDVHNTHSEKSDFNFDDFELVEFEMYEIRDSSTVGADIRNKLTPSLNLIALLKLYFKEEKEDMKGKLMGFIKKEMVKSEENIKYISNLLE